MNRIFKYMIFCAAALLGVMSCEQTGPVEEQEHDPRLISIVPGTGYVGCTAIISGEYFSEVPEENVVTVDGVTVPVIAATRNRLTLTMPEHELGDVQVGLTVNGRTAPTTVGFTYAVLPELVMSVTGIKPEKGYSGDEVTISGENFSLKTAENKVTFDGIEAQIVKATQNSLRVIAPEHSRGKVNVKVQVGDKTASTWFTYVELMIASNTPTTGAAGVEVTIKGEGFSVVPTENTVTINGVACPVKAATEEELTVEIPDNPEGRYQFVIKVGERTVTGGEFSYQGCWRIETVMGVSAGVTSMIEGTGTGARMMFGQDFALRKDGTFYMTFRNNVYSVYTMSPSYTLKKFVTPNEYKELLDGQYPWGCALDSQENLFIAAKGGTGSILKLTPDGKLSKYEVEGVTIAGTAPMDIEFDKDDNMYILLRTAKKIHKVKDNKLLQTYDLSATGLIESLLISNDCTKLFAFPQGTAPVNILMIDLASGNMTTVAGTGTKHTNADSYTDGEAGNPLTAALNMCEGSVMMEDGTIIFNDSAAFTIREFKPGPDGDYTKGTITTIAGKAYNKSHTDGLSTAARFMYPCGMSFGPDGKTIYMFDGTSCSTVRKIYYK